MLKEEIKQGGIYNARVNGNFTKVRVDEIVGRDGFGSIRSTTRYNCTNLTTNRAIVVKSAAKFRSEAK